MILALLTAVPALMINPLSLSHRQFFCVFSYGSRQFMQMAKPVEHIFQKKKIFFFLRRGKANQSPVL